MLRDPNKTNFDDYVSEYETIINRHATLAGGNLEHFIGVRLGLVAERIRKYFELDGRLNIVDFGCGIGTTEVQLAQLFPKAKIAGYDVSTESIAQAQKLRLPNVEFRVIIPGESLPCGDASVDLLYSNGTFHHIATGDHNLIFKEIHRIMKPGGHVFIFENNPFNPVTVWAMKQNPFDIDACTIAPPKMKKRVSKVGFLNVRQGYYCFFLRPLTFLSFTERYLRWFPLGAQYYTWAIKTAALPL
jgi:SAM-dependent methyltransferase